MIYVIGDSFTWGDEISDYIIPEWPGFRKDRQQSDPIQSDWMLNRSTYLQNSSNQIKKRHEELRLENRWSTIVGNELGVEVINRAREGKSTAGMVTYMVHDFLKFKKENKKVDLVIIQLTSVPRYQFPVLSKDFEHQLWHQLGYYQMNPGLGDYLKAYLDKDYFNFYKSKVQIEKDCDMVYEFLNNIAKLQLLSNLYTGKNPVIVQSVFKNQTVEYIKQANEELKNHNAAYAQTYFDLLEATDIEKELDKYPTMDEIVESSTNCNYTIAGHVCINTHKIFGQMLAEKIKETGLL